MTAFHYNLGVLHAACDSDPGIVAERKKGFPGLHFTTSLDEILKNPDIKAMAISTPAATHYEIVKQSLLAGRDVFVEKCQGKDLTRLAPALYSTPAHQ